MALIRIELIEQVEVQEQHLYITVVLQETTVADIATALEHLLLALQDQAAGLPYLELQHIEILVLALEVILQAEVLVAALEAVTITLEVAILEVVITARDEVVLAVVLTEVQAVALEVQAADLLLDHLARLEVVVAEETKIKHLSPLNY